MAGGRSTVRRRRSARRARLWLPVSLVAILVIGSVGTYFAKKDVDSLQTTVVADLQQGAGELQSAKAAVVKANSTGGTRSQLDEAIVHFQRGRGNFQHALDRVQHDMVLLGAGVVPGVGILYVQPRVNTVVAVAKMGIDLAEAGELSTQLDVALLSPGAAGTSSGQKILAVMTEAQQKIPLIRAALQRAQDHAANVDQQFLPSSQRDSFAKAKGDIAKGLTQMDSFAGLAPALIDFLGGNGTRTYLVEQPDPAELRGGGGFIGTYSLLTANKGDITLGKAGNTALIDYPRPKVGMPGYIAAPGPLRQFTNSQGFIFGDSGFLADFPQAAQTAEMLYLHETKTKVDGVVSLDPWAVAGLLAVTGPIAIPEWNITVDSATFPERVFQQQQLKANQVKNRKAFFPAVAALLIKRVMSLPSSKWGKLISVLNSQVSQRHLQIYVNNELAQKQISQVGWSGAMVRPADVDETMMEVESNFGGDKANHWLARSYDLVLTPGGGKLHHRVVISLVNSTPPGYAGGRTYACYVRFYVPTSASGKQVLGPGAARIPNEEQHQGFSMMDGWFTIKVDLYTGIGTATIAFAWDTAWDAKSTKRIYWQKQAGTLADPIKVRLVINGKTYTKTSDLSRDRVLVLTPTSLAIQAGEAGQAQLPLFGSQT
jgi:hypothetical protein